MKETIAVILPVYKGDKLEYLKIAVESVLFQSYSDLKLYIGVDGPVNDDLKSYLNGTKDPRVKIVWFDKNRGMAMVLNDLLGIATKEGYEYFARMDADDISLPNRFEKQLCFLKDNLDVDVVGGAISEIDEDGKSRNKDVIYPTTPKECREFFAHRNPHAHPAVMFRKRFFEKVGHFYRGEYRQNQDTMLWLDGFANNTVNANIPDVVLKFRMTDSLFKKRRNGWKFAKKQFKDRLHINKVLGYGKSADIYGLLMFCMLVSPPFIKKLAYRILR